METMARSTSPVVQDAAASVLRYLREHADGATKETLCSRPYDADGQVSMQTTQRALKWLRDEKDAPIVFDRSDNKWKLTEPSFTLPFLDPGQHDLEAVLFASALLEPIVDKSLFDRLQRLVEDMDLKIREGAKSRSSTRPLKLKSGNVTATVSTGKPANLNMVTKILHAINHRPLKIRYKSPWAEPDDSGREHEIEPWQLRIHDGGMYLRAFSLTRNAPRCFRVAQIESLRQLPPRPPKEKMPLRGQIWGDDDPAFGVDSDRPGHATVVLRGPVARWVAMEQWHPAQIDTWLPNSDRLRRVVPYRSCRELARRLASLGDGLDAISPPELESEVLAIAKKIQAAIG